MAFIGFFGLIGIAIIAGGFRRSVRCNPVCARCGYDVRGYAVLSRCSECGADLTEIDAVRRTTRRANLRQIGGGIVVAAIPWILIGVAMAIQFAGPRLRSNLSWIAEINSPGAFEPAVWQELARRVTIGRLRGPDAIAAVDQLIIYIRNRPNYGSLVWATPFYTAADRAGVISAAQYLQIARAYYGKAPPSISLPSGLTTDGPSWCRIDTGMLNELPGQHRVYVVREISMTGASATTQDILRRAGQGNMQPPTINLLTANPYLLSKPDVPAGKYKLKFVVQISLVPGAGMPTISTAMPSAPPPLAQWTQTISMPVDVYRPSWSQSGVSAFRVRSDAPADPQQGGSVSIISAEALCYSDATIITFRMKVGTLPVWWCFDQKLTLARQQLTGSTRFFAPDRDPFVDYFSFTTGPILKTTPVDLELTPNLDYAQKFQAGQVWGKSVTFKNIPVKRRDLHFSLRAWRADQTSHLKAGSTGRTATTLPFPSIAPAR